MYRIMFSCLINGRLIMQWTPLKHHAQVYTWKSPGWIFTIHLYTITIILLFLLQTCDLCCTTRFLYPTVWKSNTVFCVYISSKLFPYSRRVQSMIWQHLFLSERFFRKNSKISEFQISCPYLETAWRTRQMEYKQAYVWSSGSSGVHIHKQDIFLPLKDAGVLSCKDCISCK